MVCCGQQHADKVSVDVVSNFVFLTKMVQSTWSVPSSLKLVSTDSNTSFLALSPAAFGYFTLVAKEKPFFFHSADLTNAS